MYRSSFTDDLERQANRFAADILLPAGLVRAHYKNDKSLIGLSKTFNVSDAAIRIRLKELGLAP
jgi:Zn-dependent peptidase ImmA (M78 family)